VGKITYSFEQKDVLEVNSFIFHHHCSFKTKVNQGARKKEGPL